MPMQGRFTVEDGPGGNQVIAPANAQRYAPFVAFVSSVDSAAAVRLCPHVSGAAAGLPETGFQRPHLNYRVVKVIDHLLATPEPSGPCKCS